MKGVPTHVTDTRVRKSICILNVKHSPVILKTTESQNFFGGQDPERKSEGTAPCCLQHVLTRSGMVAEQVPAQHIAENDDMSDSDSNSSSDSSSQL